MQQGLHELQGSARYLAHILLLQGLGLGHVGKLQTWGVGGGGGSLFSKWVWGGESGVREGCHVLREEKVLRGGRGISDLGRREGGLG